MRVLRICAGALALLLMIGTACEALAACLPEGASCTKFFFQLEKAGNTAPALHYRRAGEGNRAWWGVLYGDALFLARAEEGEDLPEDETEVVFVWPLWEWLLRFLGLI